MQNFKENHKHLNKLILLAMVVMGVITLIQWLNK